MATCKPCPKCGHLLEITNPVPEQIKCTRCGSVSTIRKPSANTNTNESPSQASASSQSTQPEPRQSRSFLVGSRGYVAIGGILLVFGFACIGVISISVYWGITSGKKNEAEEKKTDPLAKSPLKEIKPWPPLTPEVKAAVAKGAEFIKRSVMAKDYSGLDGRFPDTSSGAVALAGLALLEAETLPSDPVIQEVLRVVREAGPKAKMIYTLGAMSLFLNRLNEVTPLNEEDEKLARSIILRIIAGQLSNGFWTYDNPPITAEAEAILVTKLNDYTYIPEGKGWIGSTSSSMTQFAILALWSGGKRGVCVHAPLLHAAARFNQTQKPDGKWSYFPDTLQDWTYFDSNTCAGILAMTMEKAIREDKRFLAKRSESLPPPSDVDERSKHAFEYLAKVIDRKKDEKIVVDAASVFYFLWCLERVAVINDLHSINGRDWYDWGTRELVQRQRPAGEWNDGYGPLPATSFAILFLLRTNLAKDLTEQIRMRDGRTVDN